MPHSGPLLCVDAPSLLYRAFFALPKTITDDDGRSVNALLGATNLVVQAVDKHRPRAVVLCDGAEAAVYRKELLPIYHADRPETPDELGPQFGWAPSFFARFGWRWEDHDTLEADDLLGSLALEEVEAGGSCLLFTGDRDMFQCVGEHVSVLWPAGKGETEVIDAKGVRARYGIGPELVPDFIALRGDPSDSIPGGKGIGEKTAKDLLVSYGSLEEAIANAVRERPRVQAALRDGAHDLRTYKEVATLVRVPVDLPPDTPTDWAGGAEAARERGMRQLGERLDKLAAASH